MGQQSIGQLGASVQQAPAAVRTGSGSGSKSLALPSTSVKREVSMPDGRLSLRLL